MTGHATGTPALVAHDETSRGPGTGPPTRHVRTYGCTTRLLHADLRFGEKVR